MAFTLTRKKSAMLLVVATLLAVALGLWADRRSRRPGVVDVLPRNTAVLIELDLPALQKSPFGHGVLQRAMDDVRRRCGADPFVGVEHVGVAIPGGSGLGSDLAVVATGHGIRVQATVACAEAMIRERAATPQVLRRGSFTTVQDGSGAGVLAVRDAGPIVIGSGMWLDAILDVAEGTTPSLRNDPIHDLRRREEKDALVTLTYALPWEERARLEPMLPKGATALTRMSSLVAALRIENGSLVIAASADCEQGSCDALSAWIAGARDILARDPRVSILGLEKHLRETSIAAEQTKVRLRAAVPIQTVDAIGSALESPSALPPPTMPPGHPSSSAVGPISPSASSSSSN